MAVQPQNDRDANDKDFMDWVSASIQMAENISLRGVNDLTNFISGKENDLLSMLEQSTEYIDKPIFKSLANDMIGVLGSFYMSEQALCCLIKNLIMTAGLTQELMDYEQWARKLALRNGLNGLRIDEDSFTFAVSETEFAKAIDSIIAIIDIIITFITLDLKDIVFPSLDFIREISQAAVGFLCIAMQEIIFTMRDSGIQYIINRINETTSKNNYAKCFPYMDFMDVLKKYIHDYGLAKKLNDLVQGWIGEGFNKLKRIQDLELPKNTRTHNMLLYVKTILQKIKDAVLSFEFCIFLNNPVADSSTSTDSTNPYFNHLQEIMNGFRNPNGTHDLNEDGYQIADDDTILQNINDGSQDANNKGQHSLKVPEDDDVRAFLQNYMGLTSDKTDQLLGDGDATGDGNGGNGVGNSCGNILNPNDITSMFNLIIEQSRIK